MKWVNSENGVKYLRSDILKSRHGFSSRAGGVSTEMSVSGLNLAPSARKGEKQENVMENLRLFARAVGIAEEDICVFPLETGNNVLRVTEEDRGHGYFRYTGLKYVLPYKQCFDGYICKEKGVAVSVRTADCLPILMEHRIEDRVDEVAAVHVGCNVFGSAPTANVGTIVPTVIGELEKDGCKARDLYVALGPCARKCCVEVEGDVLDVVRQQLSGEVFDRNCRVKDTGKWALDMPGICADLLKELGVKPENIDVSDTCTTCNNDLFFSRILNGRYVGSMLSTIQIG